MLFNTLFFATLALAAPVVDLLDVANQYAPRAAAATTTVVTGAKAVVTNAAGLKWYNGSLTAGTNGLANPATYKCFSGKPVNFPAITSWINFNSMFTIANSTSFGPVHDTAAQIQDIKSSIISISQIAKVDPRFILAIILQESSGNVTVSCTVSGGGVPNCGLMQAYNSSSYNAANVAGSINQMIIDGTQGTAYGPGLVQHFNLAADTNKQTAGNLYAVAREYNSGSVNTTDLSTAPGGLGDPLYASNIANLLLGWNRAGTGYTSCKFYTKPSTSTTFTTTKTTMSLTKTVAPPTSTVSGTTGACYQWYTVQQNDGCYSIETMFSISDAYFKSLNPELNSACSNLYLGYAYCVNGVAQTSTTTMSTTATSTASSSSSSKTSSTTVAPPTSTVSGTTTSCYQWYTVQSNDGCSSIETMFAITDAYFKSLNPEINSACTNLYLNYAYCVNGVVQSSSMSSTTTPARAAATAAGTVKATATASTKSSSTSSVKSTGMSARSTSQTSTKTSTR